MNKSMKLLLKIMLWELLATIIGGIIRLILPFGMNANYGAIIFAIPGVALAVTSSGFLIVLIVKAIIEKKE